MNALPARSALDAYFLEMRCRLLDLAAALDRVERGPEKADVTNDPRLETIRRGLAVLAGPGIDRAEQIQLLFSLPYDPAWLLPEPGTSQEV